MRLGLIMLKRGVSAAEAKKLLSKAGGNLRMALGETGKRGAMDKFVIKGGKPLHGTVAISGAKKLGAAGDGGFAADGGACGAAQHTARARHHHDGETAGVHGARVSVDSFPAADYKMEAKTITHAEAPYELVKTMRASILTLGPTLARIGTARVSLPGGCAIGARPVDLHLSALERMGAEIATTHGFIEARAPRGRLQGGRVKFEKVTVTGRKIFDGGGAGGWRDSD